MQTDSWLEGTAPARNVGGRPRSSGAGSRSRLLACACGFKCRSTVGALERYGAPTCACGRRLGFVELADLLAAGDELARESVDGAELERIERRDRRELERDVNHGFKSGAANCGVCGRFKSRPADVCGYCGDDPAPYSATDERSERESFNRGAGYRS